MTTAAAFNADVAGATGEFCIGASRLRTNRLNNGGS
jgi:hypothetical protein